MAEQTTIVNLWGGPGTGKSTTAMHLTALLKLAGFNAEFCSEYAKGVVWEGRDYLLRDQFYILAKQHRHMSRLVGQVQFIISDSPLHLGIHYSGYDQLIKSICDRMYADFEAQGCRHINVFLRRIKSYQPEGRMQTEDEAKSIDPALWRILMDLDGGFLSMDADQNAAQLLLQALSSVDFHSRQQPAQ
jgi:hypothetical protein